MKKVYTCGYMDDGEDCRTFVGREDVTPGEALMAAQLWLDALLHFHEEAWNGNSFLDRKREG